MAPQYTDAVTFYSSPCWRRKCALRFTAGLEGFRAKVFNKYLRVAQLVERETVRVALYLEVACSTQALEIPFANHLIFHFADFPLYRGIYCRERGYPA